MLYQIWIGGRIHGLNHGSKTVKEMACKFGFYIKDKYQFANAQTATRRAIE
jgi:hypothetical protein